MPDDDLDAEAAAERAVLGDELQQRGDPLGDLIQLQLALAALPPTTPPLKRRAIENRIQGVLERGHDALYGALAVHVTGGTRPDVFAPALAVTRWKAGFADEIWLQTTVGDAPSQADAYRMMRALPLARFVRRLVLGVGSYADTLAAIAADPAPPLRALVMGDRRRQIPRLRLGLLPHTGLVAPIAGQLEELELGYATPYEHFDSPTLRRLFISAPYNSPDPPPVFTGRMPALRVLECNSFRIDHGLLDRLPALEQLIVYSNRFVEDWLERFLTSSHVDHLKVVKLGGGLDAAIVPVLERHADRVALLTSLDLRNNTNLSEAARTTIRAILPNIVV